MSLNILPPLAGVLGLTPLHADGIHMLFDIGERQFVEGRLLQWHLAEVDGPLAPGPLDQIDRAGHGMHDVGVRAVLTLIGAWSMRRAMSSGMSKGAFGDGPMKQRRAFSGNRRAIVRSVPAVRSALIATTMWPSSARACSVPLSKPIMETWTVAPFKTQRSTSTRSAHKIDGRLTPRSGGSTRRRGRGCARL